MTVKPRDIIILVVVAVLCSPVAYLIVLLATGNARFEVGRPSAGGGMREELRLLKPSRAKDSLLAQYSKTFQALQQERAVIARERERLLDDQRRVDMVQQELEQMKDSLAAERTRLEGLYAKGTVQEDKRIRQLARVYTAMKAAEAARIIETLDDKTAAALVTAIGDERQRGKIMAAISQEKAARISAMMMR